MGSKKETLEATRRAEEREDAVFAEIAVERGLVSRDELDRCLSELHQRSSQGERIRLGKLLESRHLISTIQFLEVLNEQNRSVLTCPACAAQFNIRGQPPGKRLRCKHCKSVLTIPTQIDTQALADSLTNAASQDGRRSTKGGGTVSSSVLEEIPDGGHRFGRYVIESEIARGGMGIVFRARQIGVRREVALKVLKREQLGDPEAIQRFLREAQLAGRLNHPNIVPVYEVGTHDGEPFFAMALIKGQSLEGLIREKALPRDRALEIVELVSRAIQYAHAAGIVHRDLKPANVLLDEDGRPMLTDFGLAKHLEGQALTQTGVDIGTPHYMSPEQVLGRSAEIDERSDVYALGVILYQLVTRRLPFGGKTAIEIYHKILNDQPAPPSTVKRGLSRDLDAVCAMAMARERKARYPTAQAFADDVARLRRGHPVFARKAGLLDEWMLALRNNQALVGGLLGGVVLVLLGVVVSLTGRGPATPADPGRVAVGPTPSKSKPEPSSTPASPVTPPAAEPREADVLLLKAQTALQTHQYDEVVVRADQVLDVDPDNFEAYYLKGRAGYSQRKYAEAEAAFDRTLELNPYYADALYHRGLCRFNLDRMPEARDDLSRLIALPAKRVSEEDRARAHLLRGRCYFHGGQTEEAVLDFERASTILPNWPWPYHQLGIIYFARRKDFPQAKEMFDRALTAQPGFIPAMLFRGASYAYLSEFDKAFADFSAAYDLNPEWVHEFIEMGLQASAHDPKRYDFDPTEAKRFLAEFSQKVALLAMGGQVDGWKVQLYLGLYQHYIRQYGEAVKLISAAVNAAPFEHRRKLYIFRGQAYDMLGRHEEAVADFTSALETEPDDEYGRLHRATSLLKLRRLDEAEEDLRVVQRVSPNELRAYLDLGMIAALRGHYDQADGHFRKAQQISDTDSRAWSLRAWLLATAPAPTRDLAEAERQAAAGIQKNVDSALSWGIAGLVHAARGEDGEARGLYRKALEMAPAHWYFDAEMFRGLAEGEAPGGSSGR